MKQPLHFSQVKGLFVLSGLLFSSVGDHEVGVQPFIVLGQLQRDSTLDWTDFADKVVNTLNMNIASR